jgi:filamentous hemagglutinin
MKNYEGYTFSLNGAEPKQGWLNTQPFRYIYTSKGGWIDMQHFMYYASVAYNSKVNYPELTNDQAILRAAISGYRQENLYDRMFANHSAFSYEDLPSDLFGARFGAIYFNPNSKLSLSQQIGSYIETLGPMYPFMAPNYNKIPTKDSNIGNTPSYTNKNFSPMFTR